MFPLKPLFLKTYGKQKRKLSAWLSPEDRKRAFDSTLTTDGDVSVFEPAKPTRIRERKMSVAGHIAVRPVKKKTRPCLSGKSSNEEGNPSPSCPRPARQSKTTRQKKTSVASGRAVRPAKRKAMLFLIESSSDEENIGRPSPPRAQQSRTTRKSRLASVPAVALRPKRQQAPMTSASEGDSSSSAKCHKVSVQMKRDCAVHPPSASRFVTHRRRAVTAKPKRPTTTFNALNTSDDFASGAFVSSRILQPSRKKRRVPPAFVVSSAENSLNAAGTASFAATVPFREISLNESADHSLGPCPRKPIFCSTPSAGPFIKCPRLKPLSVDDQSFSPPSMSVSCIGVASTFQEDLDSPGQLGRPPQSAPPIGLHSEEKPQSSLGEQEPDLHHHEEPSCDLFVEPKRRSCSGEAKSHHEVTKSNNVGELPSLNLLSTDGSEGSSHFVSAAGGFEWLIEALKERCLTERCVVQLERLDNLPATQLCSQTTYTSCLEHSDSVHSWKTNEQPHTASSEPLFNLCLSVTKNQTSGYLQSVNEVESPERAASVTEGQSANHSPPVDCKQSFIVGTQAQFTDGEAVAVKDARLTNKCTVQIKRWPLSQVQLRGVRQEKEAGLACDELSSDPDANRSENDQTPNTDDPEDLTRSGEIAEAMAASVGQSINGSGPVADDSETKKRAAVLKEKCLTDRFVVKMKRPSLSQLKEILQLNGKKPKAPRDVLDSASEDQPKNGLQSESGTNRGNKDSSAVKVNTKQMGSASSQDKIASDKGEAAKNAANGPHKRKRTSVAPKAKKRRSTSADRPGTTRKACVSGLSVSRWKNKDGTHVFRSGAAQTGGNKAADCSINDLISAQRKQPRELLGTTVNFSTPVRASRLNLSSLLADFTPSTHTWSRLKAALSVHRKGMVLLTPRSSCPSVSGSPGGAELAELSRDLFATPFRTPLPKRLRSQLLSDSPVVFEDADLSDAEKVYAECGQQRPLPWEECILPQRMNRCVKIGEGTFGEVFSTTNASGDTVALKIIPVEGSEKVNGEDQKTFGEILHEIIISKELSSLKEKQQNQTHGFIGLNDLHCVQGCYPPDILNAWDTFDQQKGSENDRPDFFERDQLFIILEFEFGGVDLESSNGTLASLVVAKSILHQVTAAMAVAEQELHFEHRDLHWGNVLVKTTKQKTGSFLLNGAAHSLETRGVLVRIIDYSLSRLEIDDLTVSCDISKDEELFTGQGDYQFDIYRLMRQENGNNWGNYHPHTNVLWLHYLCSKLLSMKYRGSGGRGAKDMREELTRFYGNVLQYSSATETLQNCPMFR